VLAIDPYGQGERHEYAVPGRSFSFALPCLERCERDRHASFSASGVQPGRLAQGPDEKKGRAGRTAGTVPVISHSFQNDRAPLGERGPRLL
jgi:hypothetical protein